MNRLFFVLSISLLICCSEKNSAQIKNISSTKYFETVNFKKLKESYISKTIEINQQKISLDLNFDTDNTTDDEILQLNKFLVQLTQIVQQSDIEVKKQSKSPSSNEVTEYISHHLSEIPKNELYQLIDPNDKTKSDQEKLTEKIKLKRIGIYPQDSENYGVFDYTIGETYTQYLIVVNTDQNGKITDITTES